MTKEEFETKISKLEDELKPFNIEVIVDDNINPTQLSCEFYKNNDNLGYISFQRDDIVLVVSESGALVCSVWADNNTDADALEFDSDHTTATFENVTNIHSDDELAAIDSDLRLYYTNNNWFNVYYGKDDDDLYTEPDPDVIYSLADMLDVDWVKHKFHITIQ